MQKVGRYQVIDELGRGAMGVVYRAVDPNIGRTVALKTMRLDLSVERDEMLLRFRNEARAAGLMNHPNIVTIHDADESDGLFYIAMEYIEGQPLQSLMAATHILPPDRIVTLAKQVAMGLDYAHARKVVHRDIKPANIMITPQNVAKIMDFGIAKSVDTMTRTGLVLGTPHYMSPEQVMGHALDGRSDLFSFGVVLYEMATGERPFAGENVTTIIFKIVNADPIPPCELQLGLHPGLGAVVTRCLAKNPNDRYQTGAELAADLENFHSLHRVDEQATVILPLNVDTSQTQSISHRTGETVRTSFDSKATQAIAAPTEAAASTQTGPSARRSQPVTAPNVPVRKTKQIAALAMLIVVFALLSTVHWGRQSGKLLRPRSARQDSTPVDVGLTTASARHEISENSSASNVDNSHSVPIAMSGVPTSAQAPPKEKRAAIYFTSSPEGALVRFDRRSSPSWITPFSLGGLVPGTHNAVFTKNGYSAETRRLEVGPENSSYHVDLVPQTTAVSVSSNPPGANIEIDGADTGKLTPAQMPVAEGQHTIVVRLAGYRPAQTKAEIGRGEIYNLPVQFMPVAPEDSVRASAPANAFANPQRLTIPNGQGLIDFVTEPPGASIFVEGLRANRVTPAHNFIPPGDYSIELRMTGYKPVQQTVHVDAGQVARVTAKLDPQ